MAKFFRFRFNISIFHVVGLTVAFVIVLGSYILFYKSYPTLFSFLFGIAVAIGGLPFFVSLITWSRREAEKELMFLEFSRSLVESVKAGTPVSKSIINVRNKDFGVLNPHIEKLVNQISIGIPLKVALETFSRDINNETIARSINIISESEKAGGKIDDILEAVVKSVSQVEKLKKERKATMFALTVQGYMIFLIFLAIILIMQFKVLPIASQIGSQMGGASSAGIGGFGGVVAPSSSTAEEMTRPFLWLLIIQGFFAGLVIGKLAEGSIKAGFKHSFILLVISLLVNSGANLLLKNPTTS